MQYLCWSPHARVFFPVARMPSFYICNWLQATKKCSAASLLLMETALLRFAGLGADGNIICSMVGSVSHPDSFGVVSRSSRLLAVLSGDEPEANMWHLMLVWRCHRSIGGHICGARFRAIDDICATSNFSTLISFTKPAFSGLLPLRENESTQCVSVHPGTAELDSFFSLSQRWYRQEQKLIFTSLPWHVDLSGTFTPSTSIWGSCLKGNAGDVFRVVAGRVLGRLLHLNGRGIEPPVPFASRRSTRVADLCTFLQEMHFHARVAAQLNLGCAARFTDMCCAASCVICW